MTKELEFEAQNFETMFRIKDKSSVLLSELLLNGPLHFGNVLVVQHGGFWSFVIDIRKKIALQDVGKKLFGNTKNFEKYVQEFSSLMVEIESQVIPKYGIVISKININEYDELMNKLMAFWRYYGYTEFVFHDFELEDNNEQIKKNLEVLGKLKLEARVMWNKLSVNGVVYFLLDYFSRKFFNEQDAAKYLTISELREVLSGGNTDDINIEGRKKCYVMAFQAGLSQILLDQEADKIKDLFIAHEEGEIAKAAASLKGRVANKGIAKGRVIIAPMLNLEAARLASEAMQQGDILVAQSTDPNLMSFCNKAGAIVTNQGGMLSHAAIISRELGIPCIVGTIFATKVLKNGDLVEVDANEGVVRIIEN